jgi:hypothetical protein
MSKPSGPLGEDLSGGCEAYPVQVSFHQICPDLSLEATQTPRHAGLADAEPRSRAPEAQLICENTELDQIIKIHHAQAASCRMTARVRYWSLGCLQTTVSDAIALDWSPNLASNSFRLN